MEEYRLLSIWRIEAPLEEVYAAIHDSLRWPDWWPGAETVLQAADGDADGIDSIRHYCWHGQLPYRLRFAVRTTRIDRLLAIEGTAQGDLDGVGRWCFARQGAVSIVRYEWHVRSTRRWMNLLAPLARPLFIRNHEIVMQQGAEGLARWLAAPLLGQESVDLMAPRGPNPGLRHRRESGATDPLMVLLVGVAAGVLVAVAQLVLWWLAAMPLPETLFRDARLTAALLMGSSVLPPPSTAQWDIVLVATLIHFALSVTYALILSRLTERLRTGPALVAGALYGLAIFAVNLYGVTMFFPWFAVARDWVTLLSHLIFGVALAGGLRLAAAWPDKPEAH